MIIQKTRCVLSSYSFLFLSVSSCSDVTWSVKVCFAAGDKNASSGFSSVRLSQVLVNGNINTYLIKGLSPATEYEVLLSAVYSNEVESDEVILVESTGKFKAPSDGSSQRNPFKKVHKLLHSNYWSCTFDVWNLCSCVFCSNVSEDVPDDRLNSFLFVPQLKEQPPSPRSPPPQKVNIHSGFSDVSSPPPLVWLCARSPQSVKTLNIALCCMNP